MFRIWVGIFLVFAFSCKTRDFNSAPKLMLQETIFIADTITQLFKIGENGASMPVCKIPQNSRIVLKSPPQILTPEKVKEILGTEENEELGSNQPNEFPIASVSLDKSSDVCGEKSGYLFMPDFVSAKLLKAVQATGEVEVPHLNTIKSERIPQALGNFVTVSRTSKKTKDDLELLILWRYVKGKPVDFALGVTGKKKQQAEFLNGMKSPVDKEHPLPGNITYKISSHQILKKYYGKSRKEILRYQKELATYGQYYLKLEPSDRLVRYGLWIHADRDEPGTGGCIGLSEKTNQYMRVMNWFLNGKDVPLKLIVEDWEMPPLQVNEKIAYGSSEAKRDELISEMQEITSSPK